MIRSSRLEEVFLEGNSHERSKRPSRLVNALDYDHQVVLFIILVALVAPWANHWFGSCSYCSDPLSDREALKERVSIQSFEGHPEIVV